MQVGGHGVQGADDAGVAGVLVELVPQFGLGRQGLVPLAQGVVGQDQVPGQQGRDGVLEDHLGVTAELLDLAVYLLRRRGLPLLLHVRYQLGDGLGVVTDGLDILGRRPVAHELQGRAGGPGLALLGALVDGVDEPDDQPVELVGLLLAADHVLGQVPVQGLEGLHHVADHGGDEVVEPLEQGVDGELLPVDGRLQDDALGGLLHDADAHEVVDRRTDLLQLPVGDATFGMDLDVVAPQDVVADDELLHQSGVLELVGLDDVGGPLVLLDLLGQVARDQPHAAILLLVAEEGVTVVDALGVGPPLGQGQAQGVVAYFLYLAGFQGGTVRLLSFQIILSL